MLHCEILEKINESLEWAKGEFLALGLDSLEITTSVSYDDADFEEYEEYDEDIACGVTAYIAVFEKGKNDENDPSLSQWMTFNLKKGKVTDTNDVIESELAEFKEAINEYTDLLRASEDPLAAIEEECKRIEKEYQEAQAELEAVSAHYKKLAYISVGVSAALFVLALIIKSIF